MSPTAFLEAPVVEQDSAEKSESPKGLLVTYDLGCTTLPMIPAPKYVKKEEMEKAMQAMQDKPSSSFSALYTAASPLMERPYEVPPVRRGTYSFDEDDLAAYLDTFEDDQVIGLAFSPLNCMVARAISLKYPEVPYIHVTETVATIGIQRFYFSSRVRSAISLFDRIGYTLRSPGEPFPPITKQVFTNALTHSGIPPFTRKVVGGDCLYQPVPASFFS